MTAHNNPVSTNANAVQNPYYLQLAANLNAMEQANDNDGLDQMWSLYGYRDCIRACDIIDSGAELPEPNALVITNNID